MSENVEHQKESIPSNEFLIEEVAKIKAELDELKNLKEKSFGPNSVKRKPSRKNVKKKTAAKRKPARKNVKKKTAAKRKPARKNVKRESTTQSTRKSPRTTRKSTRRSKKNTARRKR